MICTATGECSHKVAHRRAEKTYFESRRKFNVQLGNVYEFHRRYRLYAIVKPEFERSVRAMEEATITRLRNVDAILNLDQKFALDYLAM